MLAFNSVYFAEISFSMGYGRLDSRNPLPSQDPARMSARVSPFILLVARRVAPPRALVSGQGERITRISVFSKQLSKKFRCPPFAPPMDSLVTSLVKGCEAALHRGVAAPSGTAPSRGAVRRLPRTAMVMTWELSGNWARGPGGIHRASTQCAAGAGPPPSLTLRRLIASGTAASESSISTQNTST